MKKSLAYIIILVVGVVIGNFLTELKHSSHQKTLKKNLMIYNHYYIVQRRSVIVIVYPIMKLLKSYL